MINFSIINKMKIVKQTELSKKDKIQIFELWNNEYPEKLVFHTLEDSENYLDNLTQKTHYLLLNSEGNIEGWAITFIRENEKWFAIIISEKLHGRSLGTMMINKLKEDEAILNGWVIDHNTDKKSNGNFYKSQIGFYIKNGFETLNETRLELEIMSAVKIKWNKLKCD